MGFEVIDFSSLYYGSKPLPGVRGGKFVQIRNLDTEFIVLSPKGLHAYHANIAEAFFLSKGITGSYNRKRDHFRTGDPEWDIIGGGLWELDEGGLKLTLSGRSMAYGRFDARGLAPRLRKAEATSRYNVSVL